MTWNAYIDTRNRIWGDKTSAILEFSSVRGEVAITVEFSTGRTIGPVHFSRQHFVNIMAAVVASPETPGQHVEGLPEYCQCESCCETRARQLAARIEAHRRGDPSL
jgi:hypothetical protein